MCFVILFLSKNIDIHYIYDIIFSLQQKQKSGEKNVKNEIEALKKILASQEALMKNTVITENKQLLEVKKYLNKIK